MIPIRASSLDDWRRYKADEMTPEELRNRISGTLEPSEAMRAGSALGAFLGNPSAYRMELDAFDPDDDGINFVVVERDGELFRFDFAADIKLPRLQLPELYGSKDYLIDGERVRLTGHADGFDGFAVDENKLTQQLDAERYAESYQWRAYLAIFGAKQVNYNVFIAKQVEDAEAYRWLIRDFRRFSFYPYPEMDRDISQLLHEFVPFVKSCGTPWSEIEKEEK